MFCLLVFDLFARTSAVRLVFFFFSTKLHTILHFFLIFCVVNFEGRKSTQFCLFRGLAITRNGLQRQLRDQHRSRGPFRNSSEVIRSDFGRGRVTCSNLVCVVVVTLLFPQLFFLILFRFVWFWSVTVVYFCVPLNNGESFHLINLVFAVAAAPPPPPSCMWVCVCVRRSLQHPPPVSALGNAPFGTNFHTMMTIFFWFDTF